MTRSGIWMPLLCSTLLLLPLPRSVDPNAWTGPVDVEAQTAPTLYEQVGGFDFIAGFVDTAFPRVAAHPELSHHFGGHSMDSQLRQRQLVVELLCWRTGGPCIYIGRALATAHEGLGIDGENWETFMGIIRAVTDELEVPTEAREDWIELWQGFRGSTVLEE